MTILRRVLSVLLVLVAVGLLPLALVTSWVDRTVADREAYLDAVTPLAEEEVVRGAVTVRVRAAVVSAIDPPDLAAGVIAEGVSLAVRRVVGSEAFPPLWRASNQVAHTSLVDVLSRPVGSGGEVRIDVSPVVEAVLDQLPGRFVPGRVRVPGASFPVADAGEIDQARRAWQVVEGRGTVVPLLALGALAGAVAVSPLRRRTVLLVSALALPALGVLALGLLGARRVLEANADPGEERELALAVWDALASDLWQTTGVAAALALVLLLLAAVAPRGRRRGQDQTGAISRV